ncbi:hypothetical protein AXG93_4804s1180 [Marchantia polymorpha subsp. ruderalis]|uniref:Uncharacterized protein n=1 Tax=Marchantia polymorpha subsp. ruderalis TaxID=1480154 RepID=A0A176VNN9_MARPO|nr:hypothetical protein AXG93_4804s1180 [Marchantia polymorpha subsp. ruderalis]
MIGSLEVVPFARPCRSFRRYSSCPLLQQKSRRLVCVRAAADNPAVPFPRINATELQGQARAQDAQKFGSGPFENPRGSFINDKESPKTSAKGKRNQNHDSSLSPDDPLPLPMTFPGSKPAPKEQIEALKLCDVEKERSNALLLCCRIARRLCISGLENAKHVEEQGRLGLSLFFR